jgi:hypothetical protein
MGDSDGKKNEKGGVKNRDKSKPFSQSGEKGRFKYPAEIDGKGEGNGKEDLEKDIDLHLLFDFLNTSAE